MRKFQVRVAFNMPKTGAILSDWCMVAAADLQSACKIGIDIIKRRKRRPIDIYAVSVTEIK